MVFHFVLAICSALAVRLVLPIRLFLSVRLFPPIHLLLSTRSFLPIHLVLAVCSFIRSFGSVPGASSEWSLKSDTQDSMSVHDVD